MTAIARARSVGFPALNPILPDLLEWLQDMNWPVARDMAGLLSEAGPEITPHLRSVFASSDGEWKYWLLSELCPKLDAAVLHDLIPDVARLADHPAESDKNEDVHLAAKEFLESH